MHLALPSLSVRRKRHEQRNSPWPQAPIHASVRMRPGRKDCRPRLHPISSAVVSVWREEMLFRPEANVRAMEDALTPVRLLSQARCAPRGHFDRENAIWYEIRLIATSLVPCVAGDGGHDVCPPSPSLRTPAGQRVAATRRRRSTRASCATLMRKERTANRIGVVSWVWVSIQFSFVVVNFRLVVRRRDPPVTGRSSDVSRPSCLCPAADQGPDYREPL